MGLMLASGNIKAQMFDNQYDRFGPQTSERYVLALSVGDGAYFNYRCDGGYTCETVVVAPMDFEVLLGFKVSKFLYLDMAVNWSVDYSDNYYDEITYITGFRPGLRFMIPLPFHRYVYLRGALPLQYTLDEENQFIVGLLFGMGMEWRFANLGFFGEVNISPYFVEIYPGYYVIPTQARVGVAFHF